MAYAHLLSNLGRNAEAAEQARQAVALDPLSPIVLTLSSAFLRAGGHDDEATAVLAKARELEPGFWTALLNSGMGKIRGGDARGAVVDLREAYRLCGGCSQASAVLGAALVKAGDRPAAEALLAQMAARDRAGYFPATSLAAVHLALGDRDGALDLLERAFVERDVRMPFLRTDARWTPLREEPRFKALLQEMRFAPLPATPAR